MKELERERERERIKGKRHRRNKLSFYSLSTKIIEVDNEIICETKPWLYLLFTSILFIILLY